MSKKLTPEFIAIRTKCDRLESIKNLNLWGNDLEDISVLKQMYNLEVVSLSVNRIRSLKDFSYLRNLRELYLRKNSIHDINDIKFLINLTNLRILWLSENPIVDTKNYRQIVIKLLPQLTKLDDNVISVQERDGFNEIEEDDKKEEDATWEDYPQDEDNLSPKIMTEENVFETNNLNNDAIRERDRDREINNNYRDNFNNLNENTNFNEIYSNNEKNKKMKDKFNNNINSGNVSPNVFKEKVSANYNKKLTQNIDDDSGNYVQNFDKMKINQNKLENRNLSNKNYKRNVTYDQVNNNIDDGYEYPKKTPQIQKSNIINPSNGTNGRSQNLLNCVLMLLKELNDNELELVKNEIDQKILKY